MIVTRMFSVEELSDLKRSYKRLADEIDRIGKGRFESALRLSGKLKDLMAEIEETNEREKSLYNPAMITRMKIAKRGFELSKSLREFEIEVAAGFEKGEVSEDAGKRFMSITKLIKVGNIQKAKDEFRYFEKINELDRDYKAAGEEIQDKEKQLRREQVRVEKMLAEMAEIEKSAIDTGKAIRYEELSKELEEIQEVRKRYVHSVLTTPVAELLGNPQRYPLKEAISSYPAKEQLDELVGFLSEYPDFGKCDAGQLCGFFGYSEKKLSHICPETTRFKKAVLGNREFFETISSLDKNASLITNAEDQKILDLIAGMEEGAEEIVGRIAVISKEKDACREEYEKNERIRKKREELSGYPKDGLEAELKDIARLLDVLHSDNPKTGDENRGGLFSIFGRLLKKGA